MSRRSLVRVQPPLPPDWPGGSGGDPATLGGRVFVRGEYWNARSDEEISAQTSVEVTAVEGMRLRVRRAILHR